MNRIPLYIILLSTALVAGVLISWTALKSINRPNTRTIALPGFTQNPDATPRAIVTPRPTPLTTTVKTPVPTNNNDLNLPNVPFTPQAPFSEWSNPKLSNGCEEASALMAMSWVKGEDLSPEKAHREILAISDYELEKYGVFLDTSAADTVDRIFKGYYKYENIELRYDVSIDDIVRELDKGNLLITPMNGQKLHNPFYTQPGPLRHMLVILGYDKNTKEFITNDPGTKKGEKYRYSEQTLFEAIHDYSAGDDLPLPPRRTAMIIIRK